jgi:hypothetical protein
MPRGERLTPADGERELAHGPRVMAELDQQEQPVRIGQRLAELRVEPVDLLAGPLVRGDASPDMRSSACPHAIAFATLLRPDTI